MTSVEGETPLEAALRLASADPAARPAFYRALLDADLLVIGTAPADANGMLLAGSKASLEQWQRPDGVSVLPVFSSVAALRRAVDAESSYLAMNARALFEMTLGTPLVLNPRNDYGKEFTPDEIASLLANGVPQGPSSHVVDEAREVLIGQPAHVPPRLIDAVSRFMKTVPEVQSASLAMIHDTVRSERPNLMIGVALDACDDARERALMREIGNVAADSSDGEPVDLVRIGAPSDGFGDYFASIAPFYRRGLWSNLKRRFGA